jgi:hypothetical protein
MRKRIKRQHIGKGKKKTSDDTGRTKKGKEEGEKHKTRHKYVIGCYSGFKTRLRFCHGVGFGDSADIIAGFIFFGKVLNVRFNIAVFIHLGSGICGGKICNATGFSQSTGVSPFQYHSTNAPYSFIHLRVALTRKTNGRSLGNFQKAMPFWK